MRTSRTRSARIVFLAIFFACLPAAAQGGLVDRLGGMFDSIRRALDLVGEKSEEFIAPAGYETFVDTDITPFEQLIQKQTSFSRNVEADPATLVQIANEFGEIRVDTWSDAVVSVKAEIRVGAETAETALAVAEAITIQIEPGDKHVAIRTVYPDTREFGMVPTEVNYIVTIPKGAGLVCENTFGDTVVRGVGGTLAIDARYGHVNLGDIAGPVTVRARGNYALTAMGLAQGGDFELHGTPSEFDKVSGRLRVSSYMADVTLRELGPEADVDINVSSGKIEMTTPEGKLPNLTATLLYGSLHSELPVEETVRKAVTYVRYANVESKQRVNLFSAFGAVYLHGDAAAEFRPYTKPTDTQEVKGTDKRELPVPEGMPIVVHAIRGDVRIEGADENSAYVETTQLVRVLGNDQALPALEALSLTVEERDGTLHVETQAKLPEEMAALGATYYRIDATIRVPRTSPITLRADEGQTTVSGLGALLNVEQLSGGVTVEHVKGAIEVFNRNGAITVLDSGGPLTLVGTSGPIFTRTIQAEQTISATNGSILVDAPQAGLLLKAKGNDVTVMALDGIRGAYNIRVEEGNIRILRSDAADADFVVTVEKGGIESAVPLTGSIAGPQRAFRGALNQGLYRVELETVSGNVIID